MKKMFLTITLVILTFSIIRISAKDIPYLKDIIRSEPLTIHEFLNTVKDFEFDIESLLESINNIGKLVKEIKGENSKDFWSDVLTVLSIIGQVLLLPINLSIDVINILINILIVFTRLIGFSFSFVDIPPILI